QRGIGDRPHTWSGRRLADPLRVRRVCLSTGGLNQRHHVPRRRLLTRSTRRRCTCTIVLACILDRSLRLLATAPITLAHRCRSWAAHRFRSLTAEWPPFTRITDEVTPQYSAPRSLPSLMIAGLP